MYFFNRVPDVSDVVFGTPDAADTPVLQLEVKIPLDAVSILQLGVIDKIAAILSRCFVPDF